MAKKSARARKAERKSGNAADRAKTSPQASPRGQTRETPEVQALKDNPTIRRRGDALDQRDSQSTEPDIRQDEGKKGAQKQRAQTVDEFKGQTEAPKPQIVSQLDHGQANHPRDEAGGHTTAFSTRARVEAPPPRDVTKLDDLEAVAEQLRLETKADNLIYMHRQERAKDKPRQEVLDGIVARLREVQGDPLPPLD